MGAFKSQPRSALRRSRMEPCRFLNSEAWGGVAHPSAELPQRRIPMWGSDSWFPGGGCLRGGDIALTCESALVVLVLTGPCLCPSSPSPSGLCFISLMLQGILRGCCLCGCSVDVSLNSGSCYSAFLIRPTRKFFSSVL